MASATATAAVVPVPTVKPKAITKDQLTTEPSIVHWRAIYSPLIPAFRQLLQDSPSNSSPNSNSAGSANHSTTPDEEEDDIVRFIAEWGGDVKKAVTQYQAAIEFRHTQLPIPRAEVLPTVRTHKLIFHGFDRAGRPVCYYRTRLHNPRDFKPEETVRAAVYLYEELQRIARQPGFGGIREEVCVVVDRTDGSPSNFDAEFVKLFIKTFKEVYPARLECFLVYPANFLFKGLWALVKPFLDAKSRGSCFILQSKEELTDFIAQEQLASFLGGDLPYEPKEEDGEKDDEETKDAGTS